MDATSEEERLTTSTNQTPGSWSSDGKWLAFSEVSQSTGADIWLLHLDGDRKPQTFLRTQFTERNPRFSPDGRWLAYESNESGRAEIYAQPFPGAGGKQLISTEGGIEPVWSRNGRELFYVNGDKMMAKGATSRARRALQATTSRPTASVSSEFSRLNPTRPRRRSASC